MTHGQKIPSYTMQVYTNRLFPEPDAKFRAAPTVYYTPSSPPQLAGICCMHAPLSTPGDVEINLFLTDLSLGVKDLANTMMQRAIEEHGRKGEMIVRTWIINVRSHAFYIKYGFREREREEEATARKDGRLPVIIFVRPGTPSR